MNPAKRISEEISPKSSQPSIYMITIIAGVGSVVGVILLAVGLSSWFRKQKPKRQKISGDKNTRSVSNPELRMIKIPDNRFIAAENGQHCENGVCYWSPGNTPTTMLPIGKALSETIDLSEKS